MLIKTWRSGHPVSFLYTGADAEGDVDALSLWVGQSVALVKKLQPTAEIVHEICAETSAILKRLGTMLGLGQLYTVTCATWMFALCLIAIADHLICLRVWNHFDDLLPPVCAIAFPCSWTFDKKLSTMPPLEKLLKKSLLFIPYTDYFPVRFQLPATGILQTRVAFLPFGPKLLKSLKLRPWVLLPRTLGEHLKKRRMELGLLQRDLRLRFKLEKETYANWEKDHCCPAMKHWPGILKFLGGDPNPKPSTLGEKLITYRRANGISRKELAGRLGADETTLWRWETDQRKPECERHVVAIRQLNLI
jgi:transcriptional regulator with XRE-family HTH domain